MLIFLCIILAWLFFKDNNTVKPPEVYEFDAVSAGVPLKYDFAPQLISLLDSQATTTATSTISRDKGSKGPTYSFYLNSETGSLPAGLKLGVDGVLRGTPTEEGDNEFEVCIKDEGGESACRLYSMTVEPNRTPTPKSGKTSTPVSAPTPTSSTNVVQDTERTEKWEGTYTNHSVYNGIFVCTNDITAPISICLTRQGQDFSGPINFPNGFKEVSYGANPTDICPPTPHCGGGNGGQCSEVVGYTDSSGNLKLTFLTLDGSSYVYNPNYPAGQSLAVMNGNSMTVTFSANTYANVKGNFTVTKVSDSCK